MKVMTTLVAAVGLLGFGMQAQAMPIPPAPAVTADAQVIPVYDGCGVHGHRGPWGGCRPGGQAGGYNGTSCPRGFHVGPHGHYCWRN